MVVMPAMVPVPMLAVVMRMVASLRGVVVRDMWTRMRDVMLGHRADRAQHRLAGRGCHADGRNHGGGRWVYRDGCSVHGDRWGRPVGPG